jgi:hypothetical protein
MATRFNRAGHYAWDLIVWSRVTAARRGLTSFDLPEHILARKGVGHPPPSLRVRSPGGCCDHFNDGFAAVHALLFANLQLPDLLSPHRYALPGPAFRGVYLWDSAFIAQIWRSWDHQVAADILRSVVALRDGDRLQHVVADFVQSSFTQPPLLAWSLAELIADMESDGVALAAELYPALRAYHQWLRQHRRLQNGLYAWRHPYESGVDNSPRFSTRSENRFDITEGVAAPDFASYMILDAEGLAACAQRLGFTEDAEKFAAEADELRHALDLHLWHELDGLYYDRDVATAKWRRVRTIASLLPLWAGAGDSIRVRRVVSHIMDARAFGTPIPLPSVALNDPAFEADMWRGPVWVNTAYAIILGLRRHGRIAEAADLAWRLCNGVYLVFQRERQIYEFYDPREPCTDALRRKQGNWWKRFTLGSGPQREFVGWSGLVNRLVIGVLFGFAHESGRRVIRPAFPAAAVGVVLRLTLPIERLTVEIAVESEGRVQGFVQDDAHLATFHVGFGERVDLDALLLASTATPAIVT